MQPESAGLFFATTTLAKSWVLSLDYILYGLQHLIPGFMLFMNFLTTLLAFT